MSKVREFVADDESQRISEEMGLDAGRARRTWIIGKESGPPGYYSEGHWETRDEYDGLISYDEYRSYLRSQAETSKEEGSREKVAVEHTTETEIKKLLDDFVPLPSVWH